MANEFKIKNGAIISGSITGVTEPTQENSTKMASTAWVKLQGYLSSLPIATASVLGAIKIGSGLSVDANGVLSVPGAASGSLRSKQTFTATTSQTTFTVAGGYTTGLIDVFLNGVLLTSTSVTASDGSTIVLIDPADIGDIVDVVVYTPLNNGFVAGTTDSLTEGTTNLFFTQARARAAVSGTAGRITYTSGVFDLATSGVTAGSYGSATAVPVVTVDAYGRITSISTSSISGALTFTGDVTGTGTTGTSTALTLANSGVTAGTYNNVATEVRPFTVDAKGRITGIGTAVTITPAWASITGKPTTISGYGITDAYTKTEIDNFLQGLDPKQSVKVATTADITLSGTQTIDGVAVVAGDRVLVKNESTAADNGIYVVAAGAWTRATDANSAAELLSAFVFVEQGTTNADTGWVCTSDNITLGTTAINFTQFSGTGAYQARLNGTGFVRMAGTTVSYITGTASQFIKGDGSLDSNTYLTGNQSITLSGDATGSGTTSIAITLANSGVTAGSYGSASAVPVITVDAKGRVTGVTTAAISGALTFTGDVTGTGTTGTSTALTLAASGVTAGTYNNVTVNAKGLVTGGSNALYLTGNQTVTISGDASGSGATSITITLANSGVTAGTYRSVTVDAKGRVTGGTNPTTVSGYGITDFYAQVISGFVVGANTTVTTADTLETAIEKLQGQVNARLTAESDTLATVTGRGATTSSAVSITNTTVTSSATTGALVVSGGIGVGGNVFIGGGLTTGALTMGQGITGQNIYLNIQNPGIGYANGFNFVRGTDGAGIKVIETASDTTMYEIWMSDNPDNTDILQFRYTDWQGANGLVVPFYTTGKTSRYVASTHTFYGGIQQNTTGFYTTSNVGGTNGSDTQLIISNVSKLRIVGSTVSITAFNTNGYNYTDGNLFWIKLDTTTTFAWGYGSPSGTAIATGIALSTSATTLSNGIQVTFSATTGAVGDTFSARVYKAATNTFGNITANSFVKAGGTASQFLKANGTVDSSVYLTANQNITLSGDATGSGTTAITVTLANSGATAGTYGSASLIPVITVDAKGRITSISTVTGSGGGTSINGTGFVKASGTTISYDNSVYTAFNSARFTGDLNTLGLSGTTGIYNIGAGYTNGAAGDLYGTMLAFWNSDISTQLHVSYNGSMYWRKSVGTTYTGSSWRTLLDSSNYTTYTVTKTGTGASGSWGISVTGNAATATNISNTGTVTLASATESNSISITAPAYATDQPVKLLNFDWYGNVFSMGNIRSGGTASNGFGFYYTASGGSRVEIARFSTTGNLTVGGTFTEQSSIRYKENIFTLQDCLSTVTKLRGVEYNRKGVTVKEIGVIAEEVHAILPEVINYNDQNEIDSVSYARLTAVLIEAVKEQQQQINELKALLGK